MKTRTIEQNTLTLSPSELRVVQGLRRLPENVGVQMLEQIERSTRLMRGLVGGRPFSDLGGQAPAPGHLESIAFECGSFQAFTGRVYQMLGVVEAISLVVRTMSNDGDPKKIDWNALECLMESAKGSIPSIYSGTNELAYAAEQAGIR